MVDYRDNPPVQIFADTDAGLARMRRTAEAAGCRIASASTVGSGAPPVAELLPDAGLLVELQEERAEVAAALLEMLCREAERGARRCVVSAPLALTDLVAALAWHDGIVLLCEAGEDERVAAVATARQRSTAGVRDGARKRDLPVLQPHFQGEASAVSPQDARAEAAYVRMLLRTRRLRTHYFRADLFADPAWDMLLDLLAAQLEGKKVAVSSLCIAAAVPPTTALRWIGVLAENELIVRVADPDDGRRVHVELAPVSERALRAWLHEARRMLDGVR